MSRSRRARWRLVTRLAEVLMKVTATLRNEPGSNSAWVATDGVTRELDVPAKEGTGGSAISGGEFLFLALATCYCNDIYREARDRGISVDAVTVEVDGAFPAPGAPARDVRYRARVRGRASADELRDLMRHTDTVAEIQNSLRRAVDVDLADLEVESI